MNRRDFEGERLFEPTLHRAEITDRHEDTTGDDPNDRRVDVDLLDVPSQVTAAREAATFVAALEAITGSQEWTV